MSGRKPPLAIRTKQLPKKDDCPSPSSQATARSHPISAEFGLLYSETTAYYLVRCGEKWTSVAKGSLFSEKNTAVPRSTPFSQLKGRKVRLQGKPAQAYLDENCEELESATVPTEGDEADIEPLATLSRVLFTDLAAISNYCKQKNADPKRIDEFLQQRTRHYRKHSAGALTQLRAQTSHSTVRARREIEQAVGNFPSTEEKRLVCDLCRTAAFNLMLSCGHRACRRCTEMLVRCPNCKTPFTSSDRKLLHLDRYKRSQSTSKLRN